MVDYLPLISAIANLLVATGALIVFIGIFVLLVRLGHAVEMIVQQESRNRPGGDGPPV